jgi:hypothetical protein
MKTTIDNRKQRLEDMKKSPGRDTRNYSFWYDMLKGMPYREKVTIELADLVALGAVSTNQLKVLDLPAGAELLSLFIHVKTPLAGGVLAAATISVGEAGPWTGLLGAGDCFAAGLLTAIGIDMTAARAVYSMAAGSEIKAEIVLDAGAGETFDNLTAGEIDIHYTYVEHN